MIQSVQFICLCLS